MVEVECGGFVFTSNFESGNMARVEQVLLPPKPPPLPGDVYFSHDSRETRKTIIPSNLATLVLTKFFHVFLFKLLSRTKLQHFRSS